MKREIRLAFLALVLTSTQVLNAQNHFKIEIQGGPSFNNNTLNGRLFSNWGNGLSIGGGVLYQLFPSFDIVMNVSYQAYPYQGDNLQLAAPSILGWRQSVTGLGSNIIEASFAIQNSPNNSTFYTFFSLRGGILRVDLGEIIVSTWHESSPETISKSTLNETGTLDTKGFAAFGLGLGVQLNSNTRVIVESRIIQTFDIEQTLIPILFTLQLDLKKTKA